MISCQVHANGPAGDSTWLRWRKMGQASAAQGDYLLAMQYVRQSTAALRDRVKDDSSEATELVRNHYLLGKYYHALGQVAEEMKAWDSCIAVSQRAGMVDRVYLFALWNRTKYLFDIGDFSRCIDYARVGEADARKVGDPDHYYNNFLIFHINAELLLNDYAEGERLLVNQVEAARVAAPEYLWRLYAQTARVMIWKKEYAAAFHYYEQAFQAARALKDDLGCLEILVNQGYYEYEKGNGDLKAAAAMYRKALAYVHDRGNQSVAESLEVLNLLTNMANIFVQKGQYDSAYRYYQLAYDQLIPGINETGLSNTSLETIVNYDRVWFLTTLMIDKGDARLCEYRANGAENVLQDALRIYKAVDKVLGRLKSEQAEITSRLFWRTDSRRLYEHAITAAWLAHRPEEAFYFFEKSRSVLLSDEIRQQRFIRTEDLEKQAQWKMKILSLKQEAGDPHLSVQRHGEVTAEIFQYEQRLDSLEKGFRIPAEAEQAGPDQVRKVLLKDHTALLEIFNGDSSVYVLLLTKDKLTLTPVSKAAYDSLAGKYLSYVSDPVTTNRDIAGWLHTSHELYQLLLPADTIPGGRILVSPDGRSFPFEALVVRMDGSDDPHYFLQDHAVSYIYSARYLLGGQEDRSGTAGGFMGMAPVDYAASLDLPTLSGSDASLDRIGRNFGDVKQLCFRDASRTNFLRQFSHYRIIQLYTHAADSSGIGGDPVIYFADSALYLSELISGERPATRLIVLSACETGNGKSYAGEGVFSFNRGFAALGVPSSLINLWAVENQSTYSITELFYRYLAEGQTADVALQRAKLAFMEKSLKEKRLPYYWAASVLTGRSDAIAIRSSFRWQWALTGILLAAILFMVVVWIRLR